MSPFRYVLKRAGTEHPVGYSLAMLSIGMIVCMLAAVTISVKASNRAMEQSERQHQQAQAEAHRAACRVIVAQDEAFHDPEGPPVTEAGRNAAKAWRDLRQSFQC